MNLSVIFATRNRTHAITGCLDSIAIAFAKAAPLDAEIVFVDNGSTDNTSAIVRQWAKQCAFPVRLLFQPRKGQTFARNTGIGAARGELLLWTDDDCRMDRDYVTTALRYDTGDGKELVLRGGRVELGDADDLPVSIKTGTVARRYHKNTSPAPHGNPAGALIGANMMMRRALVDRLGLLTSGSGRERACRLRTTSITSLAPIWRA